MESQLIFDLKDVGYPWHYTAVGLLVAATMGLVALFANPRSELRQFCIAGASLFALWMGVLVSTTYPAYSSLLDAELHGHVIIVEGAVTKLHRAAGFRKESFCVDSRCFHYTPETVPVTFKDSPLQGGPVMRDGLHVRIASVGEAIVRLEVLSDR